MSKKFEHNAKLVEIDPGEFFAAPLDPTYTETGNARRVFPLDALGPDLCNLFTAYAQVYNTSPAVAVTVAGFVGFSAYVNGFLETRQYGKKVSQPLSLLSLTFGAKGTNKDPALKTVRRNAKHRDNRRVEEMSEQAQKYDQAWRIYARAREQYEGHLVKKMLGTQDDDAAPTEPKEPDIDRPRDVQTIITKGTQQGLEAISQNVYGSANVLTDEGSAWSNRATGEDGQDFAATMIAAYQGNPTGTVLAASQDRVVERFCASMNVSIQPAVFFDWLRKVYSESRKLDSGLLERTLIAKADSVYVESLDVDEEKASKVDTAFAQMYQFIDQITYIPDPAEWTKKALRRQGKPDEAKRVSLHPQAVDGNIIPFVEWDTDAMAVMDEFAMDAVNARHNSDVEDDRVPEAIDDIEVTNWNKSGIHVIRLAALLSLMKWAYKNRGNHISKWDLQTANAILPRVDKETAEGALRMVKEYYLPMRINLMAIPFAGLDHSNLQTMASRVARNYSAEELKTRRFEVRGMVAGRWLSRSIPRKADAYVEVLEALQRDRAVLQVGPSEWMFNPQLAGAAPASGDAHNAWRWVETIAPEPVLTDFGQDLSLVGADGPGDLKAEGDTTQEGSFLARVGEVAPVEEEEDMSFLEA